MHNVVGAALLHPISWHQSPTITRDPCSKDDEIEPNKNEINSFKNLEKIPRVNTSASLISPEIRRVSARVRCYSESISKENETDDIYSRPLFKEQVKIHDSMVKLSKMSLGGSSLFESLVFNPDQVGINSIYLR